MAANVIFDIILVGILLVGAILGYKNGFIDTVAKPVKCLLLRLRFLSQARSAHTS